MIDIEWLRKTCLAFPGATEQIQWEIDLLFKVGGKMFAIAATEPTRVCLTFKCSDESFVDLTERPGVIPAPYLARAKWAALETPEAIPRHELAELLKISYDLVFANLPKRVQQSVSSSVTPKPPQRKNRIRKSRKKAKTKTKR